MEEERILPEGVRPELLTYDDICEMVPQLSGHKKLVEKLMHWIYLDRCNRVHSTYCYETGVPFSNRLIDEEYKINKIIENEEVLDQFKDTPFITVSNHPFGALDGILLIDIVGRHRPDFKVMVNLILNCITAMRPNFIAVDPLQSNDPEKKKITMNGIRASIKHVRDGHPLGFFPAGAVSKIDKTLHISDREWQPSIIRLIKQLKVPVIPIYFHGHNSTFFNILGLIDWRLRTLRLPREVWCKQGSTMHISIGNPISVETQDQYSDLESFGKFLREQTYALKK
jgi:putative hemolysin